MYQKLFENWKKYLKEDVCDAFDVSSGLITPDGKYIEIHEMHIMWARKNVPKLYPDYQKEFPKMKLSFDALEYLIYAKHWIRVANAAMYTGPHISKISKAQINIIQQLVDKCFLDSEKIIQLHYESEQKRTYNNEYIFIKESDPKRFIAALQGRNLAKSQVSMFRETEK